MFVIEMIFESFGSFPLLLRAIHGGVFVRLPRYGKWKLLDCDQSKFLEENIDMNPDVFISQSVHFCGFESSFARKKFEIDIR